MNAKRYSGLAHREAERCLAERTARSELVASRLTRCHFVMRLCAEVGIGSVLPATIPSWNHHHHHSVTIRVSRPWYLPISAASAGVQTWHKKGLASEAKTT